MSDKSQDSPKSPPPETSTSSESQPNLATTLDNELSRACEIIGSHLPMWSPIMDHIKSGEESTSIVDRIIKSGGLSTETTMTCSSDVDKSERGGESSETTVACSNKAKCSKRIKDLLKDSVRTRDLLSDSIARLNVSRKKESELVRKTCKLEEENTRMKENEKLLSSELPKLLTSLKMVRPNVATPSDPAAILRAVREYLNDRKNQESSASKRIAALETHKNKLSKDLDVTKSKLEQANCEASNARDEANKRLLELQDSLENAERSLASHGEKATEWGKVIDEMNEVISHIELPQEVVSMDIAHKVKWLADERKKTCEDLGSAKVNLEQANSRADAAEKELKVSKLQQGNSRADAAEKELKVSKLNLEQANSRADAAEKELKVSKLNLEQANSRADAAEKELKVSKLNLEQANSRADAAEKELKVSKLNLGQANSRADAAEKELKVSKLNLEQANSKVTRELGAMKLNLEQAKSELDVRCTELNAAEIKVRAMEEIKHVISPINFPKEIDPMDTLTSVKWLADYYKNFTDSSNEEEAKRLLANMKANIHRKIVDKLSERIRVIVEAAVGEASGVENPNPGASHTDSTNIKGPTTNEPHSGSGEGTIAETDEKAARKEGSNLEASSSAVVADTFPRELEQRSSGTSTPVEQDFGSEERYIDEPAADNRYDGRQSTSTATRQVRGVVPGYGNSPQQHLMLYQQQQQQQQQALPQPPRSVVAAPRALGLGYPPRQQPMLYQQQQLLPQPPGPVVVAPWAFGPGYGYPPQQHHMVYQQQQLLPQPPGPVANAPWTSGPAHGYSPQQQFMFSMPDATHQQQQQEMIHFQGQAFHAGFHPGYGYSPYQQQQQQFGDGYFIDSSGELCFMPYYYYYYPGDGSAGGTDFQGGGRGGRGHGQWRGRGRGRRGRGRGMEG